MREVPVREAAPPSASSVVERYADRLGDLLAAADALVARKGRRLLRWWHTLLALVGVGGLALLVIGAAPLRGAAVAALVLALTGCLSVDRATSGPWRPRGPGSRTDGGAWDR